MNLETNLRNALRRESPPPGLAGRVLERIEQGETKHPAPARVGRVRWWRAAAASVALAAVLGGYATHRAAEQRRIEGEHARDQVLLAMRIAGEKVRYAQQEVRSIGSRSTDAVQASDE